MIRFISLLSAICLSASIAHANCTDTRTGRLISNADQKAYSEIIENILKIGVIIGWASENSKIKECMIGERLGIIISNGDRILLDPRMNKYILITKANWNGKWPPKTTCFDMKQMRTYNSNLTCGDY